MLLKRELLEQIKAGEVDLVFRRWSRPSVRAGGTLKTKVGVLTIKAMDEMDPAAVTDAEARQWGKPCCGNSIWRDALIIRAHNTGGSHA